MPFPSERQLGTSDAVKEGLYVYQALSSSQNRPFRLLRLIYNSDEDAKIFCELIHCSLETCRDYEAVSYTVSPRSPFISYPVPVTEVCSQT